MNLESKYLDASQVKTYVLNYLTEEAYAHAIMIDGEWGSGKTYFIKEILIPALAEGDARISRKAVYVSLYGKNNVNDVADSLQTAILENKLGKGKRALPFIKTTAKTLTEFTKIIPLVGDKVKDGVDAVKDAVMELLPEFIDYKEYYFIFDDLERCTMPINEILGYINHFVEQNSAKVIVVAYEHEIQPTGRLGDVATMFLVASQDTIEWPQKEMSSTEAMTASIARLRGDKAKATDKDVPVPLYEVIRRSKFITDTDEQYSRVKEKVIGQTLYYRPNLKDVIDNVLINSKLDSRNRATFADISYHAMHSQNYHNIRTLQFVLLLFNKIVRDFPASDNIDADAYKLAMENVLSYTLETAIAYKMNGTKHEWSEIFDYTDRRTGGSIIAYDRPASFTFVDKYVYAGYYDAAYTTRVLTDYLNDLCISRDNKDEPLNNLAHLIAMEDNEIIEAVASITKRLLENKYNQPVTHFRILHLFLNIEDLGFPDIPINQVISYIKGDISRYVNLILDEVRPPDMWGFQEQYAKYVVEIKSLVQDHKNTWYADEINDYFTKGTGWGEQFLSFCFEHLNTFFDKRAFFSLIEHEKCLSAINSSRNKDLDSFISSIRAVYNLSNNKQLINHGVRNYQKDVESVRKLLNALPHEYDGIIRKYQLSRLKEVLNDFLRYFDENPQHVIE